jgi:outer membrane protein insertion porin family
MSGGVVLPWARDGSSSINVMGIMGQRLFVGKRSSLVYDLDGPTPILDLCDRVAMEAKEEKSRNRCSIGDGGVALAGFADLSFDLPLGPSQRADIYGHCFLGAGSVLRPVDISSSGLLSPRDVLSKLKYVAGVGIVVPAWICRIEVKPLAPFVFHF